MSKEFKNWFNKYLVIQQVSLPVLSREEKIAEAAWGAAKDKILGILKDNIREYRNERGGGDYIHIVTIEEIDKL